MTPPGKGIAVAVGLVVALSLVMLPFRTHISVATAALVLVVPVVVGVALGGYPAGLVAIGMGFLAYDLLFIPPYSTLYVGAAQNWVALAVYVAVMLVVARVVGRMDAARMEARARADDTRRLFDLSEALMRDVTVAEVLETVVSSVTEAFEVTSAAVLVPEGEALRLASSTGLPLTSEEIERIAARSGTPVHAGGSPAGPDEVKVVALVASGRAVGLLALRGLRSDPATRELLGAVTNQAAVAVERLELRDQALRAQVVEAAERQGQALIGAVSHDLRTPLATIKVAASTLLDQEADVSGEDRRELAGLIDAQADRLDRLVANLLDVTRIQAGSLELRRESVSVVGLVSQATSFLGLPPDSANVKVTVPNGLPDVDVDPVLIRQVLMNLLDNALRYAPDASSVTIAARTTGQVVEVEVSDEGPGVADDERLSIFQMMNRREAGGRGGLGLGIVRAFVEAHGQTVWVEQPSAGRGARFVFTLPVAAGGAGRS